MKPLWFGERTLASTSALPIETRGNAAAQHRSQASRPASALPFAKALRNAATVCFVAASVFAGAAMADPVPNPLVTGPVAPAVLPQHPSHDYPFFATDKAVNLQGYIEEEYFFEGTANRYDTPTGATATIIDSGNPYKSRMVVRRPLSDSRFNGVVIVEWYNVTAGADGEADWFLSHKHQMEAGYAFVGVSAQRVGVDFLRSWSPVRYGTLDVTRGGTITNDALSYDIYSQAGKAVASPVGVDPLHGLRAQRTVIADGESQSAGRLLIYVNSIMPRGDNVFPAVILHSSNGLIRSDNAVKVFRVQSEYDSTGTTQNIIQPDTNNVRVWEVAATAHYDYDMQESRQTLQIRDVGTTGAGLGICTMSTMFTRTPMKYVFNRVLDLTTRWVQQGMLPPIAPRMQVASYTPSPFGRPLTLARDEHGIAQGGIRLPDAAVPTALNHAENSVLVDTGLSCGLYGHWIPFSMPKLNQLYPTHLAYVNAVIANTRANIRAGFINRSDGRQLATDAVNSNIGADNMEGTGGIDFDADPDFAGPDF